MVGEVLVVEVWGERGMGDRGQLVRDVWGE